MNQLLTLSSNVAFSNNIFYIKDSDGTNYMSFNKTTKSIKFLQTTVIIKKSIIIRNYFIFFINESIYKLILPSYPKRI